MAEIEYPVGAVDSVHLGLNEVKKEDDCDDDDDGDDVLVEISDECPGKPREVRELQLLYQSSKSRGKVLRKGAKRVASDAKIKVLQEAEEFKSENPHFIAYMSESLISRKRSMRIPRAHFRECLKGRKGKKMIVLRDGSNGRAWNIPYYVTKSEADRGRLGVAWRGFMSDNRLQVGDVCIFELISRRAKTYNVTILRVTNYS